MPEDERRERMAALRRRVHAYDVDRWSGRFLEALHASGRRHGSQGLTPPGEIRALAERLRSAPLLVLALDYDGTLVPLSASPELARPDAELLALLRRLAERPGTQVSVVSGRRRETLSAWLGGLPLSLYAEHGLWAREGPGQDWYRTVVVDTAWRAKVLDMLRQFEARTPGALVEEKTASLAWHYRMVDAAFGEWQAKELQLHLTELLANVPVQILPGSKVIEVRPHGVHKGLVAEALARRAPASAVQVAMGDDATDEDLFAALAPGAVTLHVGPGESRARHRLDDPWAARDFLERILGPT
jgi:trehalose 6-phosphate synthase/phosphatase